MSKRIEWSKVLTPYDIVPLFTDGEGKSIDHKRTSADVYMTKVYKTDPPKGVEAIEKKKRYQPGILQFANAKLGGELISDRDKMDFICQEDELFATTLNGYCITPDYDKPVVIRAEFGNNAVEWGEDGTSDIPTRYFLRIQHDLLCTGWEWGAVAVLMPDHEERLYMIERDEDTIDKIWRSGHRFWSDCVETKTPPKETQCGDIETLARIRRVPDKVAELSEEDKAKFAELQKQIHKYSAIGNYCEKYLKELKARVLSYYGDAELVQGDMGLSKYVLINQTRVDNDRLKVAYPDVYRDCLKDTSYRKYDFKPINKVELDNLKDSYILEIGGTLKEKKGK